MTMLQGLRQVPHYLRDQATLYAHDPRAAAVQWFGGARFGLFIHYGLYSLLGRGEWVQLHECIPVADIEKLAERFTAENFNADWWADLAVDAGMRYINLTTRHHDGFCLWNTRQTDFSSVKTRCGRDLVGEFAKACNKRGLGLCLYYSHGRDWRHPHAPNNDGFDGFARPEYDPPESTYAIGSVHDLQQYVNFMAAQIRELLTNYGPIAAIWLDGIAVPMHPKDASGQIRKGFDPRIHGDVFECQKLYDMIHQLQPQCLVSYKQGYLHTEDFYAPERKAVTTADKPREICQTMMPQSWGHDVRCDGQHKNAPAVWDELQKAWGKQCNLLLNCGPLPDGSIHPEDQAPLREVGKFLRQAGLV